MSRTWVAPSSWEGDPEPGRWASPRLSLLKRTAEDRARHRGGLARPQASASAAILASHLPSECGGTVWGAAPMK